MNLFTFALLCSASPAFASPAAPKAYNLNLQVSQNGKVLAAPLLSVLEGEHASVEEKGEHGGTFLEVVAKQEAKDPKNVLVELTVGSIDEKGKRTVIGRPKLIALENETASATTKDKRHGELSVSVTARPEL